MIFSVLRQLGHPFGSKPLTVVANALRLILVSA